MADHEIFVKELGKKIHVTKETSFFELSKMCGELHKAPIMAAKSGNSLIELCRNVNGESEVEFIDLFSLDGIRIYTRGALFILFIAIRELFGSAQLNVHHSRGTGLVCNIEGIESTPENLLQIEERMRELVKEDIVFEKATLRKFEAIRLFSEDGQRDKALLFKYRKKSTVNIYRCKGFINYFYGYMPYSTGAILNFSLIPYGDYFILNLPDTKQPDRLPKFVDQPKISTIFLEHERWGEILGVKTIGEINEIISKGPREIREIVNITESLHEKKIGAIADQIAKHKEPSLILIAGPSSSGKTTFSKRLMLHLKVLGMNPVQISIDDYFVDREKTPLDENGNYDFESIHALNIDLFNEQISQLLDGKEVLLPKFDFMLGKSGFHDKPIRISEGQPVIIEGIHGLNELLSSSVPRHRKFKIYVSALTQMNLDSLNRIPTTDVRLLRRIVRDNRSRGHSALDTMRMWPSVRRGEDKYIFPFQEEADVMFNSAIVYELAALKGFAEPLLVQIDDSVPEYIEAKRLLRFIDYLLPMMNLEDIPRTSIIKEFIGDSVFGSL
ncbi:MULTISPECIES: nucleoside kinase [Mesotoga]|jgi:uridine kinase|uniref:Uridine kinase n=2 Tax=Mesotoga prima TaxID=1184387 RepID=I2F5E2_9BACT|nr:MULTISPECIES: nucleoside kinase [Mesotoga]MCP5457160.1 nucleoside kinase [Thermotogota bacterium]CCU83816.1 Phosphoribulokinase / uridine kinase family protein [Mesotoga infera]AFK07145.1 uridine kinase [Mesotoga prima MesG1.Ag.4.2]MCP5460379.1 nucleoside kinase [Thermotogota bacterium]HNQ70435.1 nucleoside kinase [Mesotoga prima]